MKFMDHVLIVGSGGREHALLKALLRSDRPMMTFAYPGNPGIMSDGCTLVDRPIDGWVDLADWAESNRIDLTVVGPELPLVEGIVDTFQERDLAILGPTKSAARIEGSKEFAKKLMHTHGIPTAEFKSFSEKGPALAYLHARGAPIVVKASGLAAGKGAIVCETVKEAEQALEEMFDRKSFGDAGSTVVLEEKMVGEEASVFVLTDGSSYRILPSSQDHKPIGEGDTGPNTGGMGAYAPVPAMNTEVMDRVEKEVVVPTLEAMRDEGCPYRGLLYVGIMLTDEGPRVVEYNCRFGDPETQAVLPLVRCDWFEVLRSAAQGKLDAVSWEVLPQSCVTVVAASKGYPGKYEKNLPITGIEETDRGKEYVDVYQSGTAFDGGGNLVTAGGRVLSVSTRGETLEQAVERAYRAIAGIRFEGMYYRKDIAAKGLARLRTTQT